MPAPTIFGVEGREVDGFCDWQFASMRAVCVWSRGHWIGVWQAHLEAIRELFRTESDTLEGAAASLELWLRLWLTSLGEALGLELRERKP